MADGGDEVYHQVIPFWDGEDDAFDVHSVEDVNYLPNLKKMNNLFLNKEEIKALRKRKIKVSDY